MYAAASCYIPLRDLSGRRVKRGTNVMYKTTPTVLSLCYAPILDVQLVYIFGIHLTVQRSRYYVIGKDRRSPSFG